MNRRLFIACPLCLFQTGVDAKSHAVSNGCFLIGSLADSIGVNHSRFNAVNEGESLVDSTGNPEIDKRLGRALARAAKRFGVSPSFSFYREKSTGNAYASPETTTAGTWGSVVFGRKLFDSQFGRYQDGGVSIIAIVAHEFAHIVQFKNKLIDELQQGEPTVRRPELHADYLAGWHLGWLKQQNQNVSLWASGDTFRRIGDYQFNEPNHHGTPEQRIAATEAGFALGRKDNVDISDAIAKGLLYMRKVKLD